MDDSEKAMVSRNELNRALGRQITKRIAAGTPSPEMAAAHLSVVNSAPLSGLSDFFVLWEKYYPTLVSLLGYASWVIPGKVVNVLKALLAIVNNYLIPMARDLLK